MSNITSKQNQGFNEIMKITVQRQKKYSQLSRIKEEEEENMKRRNIQKLNHLKQIEESNSLIGRIDFRKLQKKTKKTEEANNCGWFKNIFQNNKKEDEKNQLAQLNQDIFSLKYKTKQLVQEHNNQGTEQTLNVPSNKLIHKYLDEQSIPNQYAQQIQEEETGKNKNLFSSNEDEQLNFTNEDKTCKICQHQKFNSSSSYSENFNAFQMNQGILFNQNQLLQWIRENIVGFNTSYESKLNLPLQAIYVDHTATNRPFKTVETMIDYAKLYSANPHTEFSLFGKYSTQMMHYAHQSLLRSFTASEKQYVVLPTGSGSTGAIEKCVRILKNLENQGEWKKPTVFVTPYEHHSNILPWVEFYEKVEILKYEESGTLNMDQVYLQLCNYPKDQLIVSVSATSNVTSKKTNLSELNNIIKRIRRRTKKKLAFGADCAAFCCHEELNLSIYDQLDFAFISPHKNLGGAETCGLLLARKTLIDKAKPTFPGGGTVRFVSGYTKDDVMYSENVFEREIAGTPPFFGYYRAALSFELLKNAIGYDFIKKRERRNTELFFGLIERANQEMKREGRNMVIQLYGERNLDNRANVITFNFQYGKLKFIQHSFASLLFTDIFGIQLRSGCFCAGPYGIELLHITRDLIDEIEDQVEAGIMINKPGYLRIDLTFYLEEYEIEYIAKAMILIARYWQNLEKLYTICKDGEVILLPSISRKEEKKIFSIANFAKAFEKVQKEQIMNKDKLSKRRETLKKQLKMGQYIAKNPIDFIKKMKAVKSSKQ